VAVPCKVTKHQLGKANLPGLWPEFEISDFGSDTSGTSTARADDPNWEDGSPLMTER